jgi:prepilin-type processing-associated H-X9-DG protein
MTEVARLRKIGFVAGVDENLITPANPDRYGLSSVQQFSSAAGAKSQLAHLLSAGGPWQYFSVSGIPGARGFDSAGSTSGGRNVAFVDGDYLYAEGAGWQGGSNFAVSRSAVSAAARLIYHRVS